MMEWIATLIGAFGIGSLATSIATHFMSRRASAHDRWYQEKREAYLGLLNALHEAAVHPSGEHSKACALWQTRRDLFGSPTVSKYVQMMIDTTDKPRTERNEAFQNLVAAMKSDLKN
jgi:hypothetical protein